MQMKKNDQRATCERRKIAIKKIALDPALIRQIAAEPPTCTENTVRNALVLTNPRQGEQPDRIRRRARELGGVEVIVYKWINL